MRKIKEGDLEIVRNNRFIVRFPDVLKEIKVWSVSDFITPNYDFKSIGWSDSELIIRRHVSHKEYSSSNKLIESVKEYNKLKYSEGKRLILEIDYLSEYGEVIEVCCLTCILKEIKFSNMRMNDDRCSTIKLIFTTIDFNITLPK
tara:strand:+ start:5473 stop:5907 length:435 start_codon:yes stop_codon:yes gene_type:complete